jgi:hypothetical protein
VGFALAVHGDKEDEIILDEWIVHLIY